MNLKCSSHIITSAKLAIWLKQVNVVGAHIVFNHSNVVQAPFLWTSEVGSKETDEKADEVLKLEILDC